jgi:hypothetical protein
MSEKDKTDWSFLEPIQNPEKQQTGKANRTSSRSEIVPVEQSNAPAPLNPDVPNPASIGFFESFTKKGQLEKKARIQELETYYEKRLDVLAFKLEQAGQVEKARSHLVAEEYLKELDAKHLEVLSQIGLRNKDTRERGLLQLTDMTVARIKEVHEKDWPPEIVNETIQELFALRKRYVAEMMRELGE